MTTALTTKEQQASLAIFSDDRFEDSIQDVVDRIKTEAESSEGVDWMTDLTQYTSHIADMTQKTLIMHAAILSTVEELWSGEKISPDITTLYEGNFWRWAKQVSQRGVSPPSETALMNQMAVYRFYFRDQNADGGFCLPENLEYQIEIEQDGDLVLQDIVIENPNLYTAAYGKLLAAKGLAVRQGGNLNDETVAMMLDSDVTVREFKDQLARERKLNTDPLTLDIDTGEGERPDSGSSNVETSPDTGQDVNNVDDKGVEVETSDSADTAGVYYHNGFLMYTQGELSQPVFMITTPDEAEESPLTQLGRAYVLSRFGIEDDNPNLLEPVPYDGPPVSWDVETASMVLSLDGYSFASLDLEKALELQNELTKVLEDIAPDLLNK